MFNVYGDGVCVRSCVLESELQYEMEQAKGLGYDKVESRPLLPAAPAYRTMEEINAEKAWKEVEA
jgi:hypothetical protein